MKTWQLASAAAVFALLAACADPEADWARAAAENTEAAWQAFIEKHPDGEWAQRAQAELDTIKDTQDWENARATDAIEAYNNYLLAHPTGAHMGEARQRIAELETDAAWSAASTAGTREALEEFLTRYADAPQAEQARAQLAALAPPAPPAPPPKPAPAKKTPPGKSAPARVAGDWQVQLGAYSALDKAQAEKTRMEKSYHNLLGTLSIQKPTGGDSLYRVKSSGMTEATARSACQKLKGSGQDCMVVRR
jgi:hypothetical protein